LVRNHLNNDHNDAHTYLYHRVRELLHYEPATGVFTWKVPKSNWVNTGDRAGYVHASGYRFIKIDGKAYRARHLAWLYVYGSLPSRVYSINGVRGDNRIENLFV
jgi:Demerecviridae HNH endonuclease